jgi:hypothetical protein
MAIRKFVMNRLREPPPTAVTPVWQQVERLVGAWIVPYRIFWENLQPFRAWWPVLLPALLLYLRYRYRRERAEYLDNIRRTLEA